MVFTNPIAVRSWGRPKSCRTALLAILCWEALRGMKQQLNLNVWILATMGLCVREQLYFGLFGCYQCNIKCNGKRLSMEKNPNQPTQCVQSPTRTANAGAPQCFSWLWLWVWGEYELPELPERHIPSTALVFCLSNTSVRIFSAPHKFFLWQWLHCVFGSALSNLQIAHPVLLPTLIPAPGPGSLLAQRGTAWSYPPQGASQDSSPSWFNSASLFLKFHWELQKSWALVASCARAHYSGVWGFFIAVLFLKLSWG